MLKLEDDRYCFACGEHNPIGLRLAFRWDGEILHSAFVPRKEHQGYKDVIHGGIITTVLDECMAQAAIRGHGYMAATVEVSVRFRSSLLVGEEVHIEARVNEARHGLMKGSAVMRRTSDGTVIAEAEGRLMRASG